MNHSQSLDAIYENGVLRPLQELKGVPEHSTVNITVVMNTDEKHPLHDYIGILSNEEAESLSGVIREEFGRVDIHEW